MDYKVFLSDLESELQTIIPAPASFFVGDPYAGNEGGVSWNTGVIQYPSLCCAVNNIETLDGRYDRVTLYLYVGDRLTRDASNMRDVQGAAVDMLRKALRRIMAHEGWSVDGSATIRLFSQKFADYLAGAYAQCTVLLPAPDCE